MINYFLALLPDLYCAAVLKYTLYDIYKQTCLAFTLHQIYPLTYMDDPLKNHVALEEQVVGSLNMELYKCNIGG